MLFSLLSLAIAISAVYLSNKLIDEGKSFPLKVIGLLSLFLSLVHSPWLIKLSIVATIVLTPVCIHQYYRWPIRCPPNCISRQNCRHVSI
ncbi:hypothetical protein QUA82_23585 [Microcoleus sp. F8-D3]